jgi:hypothetical protein
MRAATITAVLLIGATAAGASRNVYHPGFVRRGGGYVAPHFHTDPPHSRPNNWSSRDSANPVLGKKRTAEVVAPKPRHRPQ